MGKKKKPRGSVGEIEPTFLERLAIIIGPSLCSEIEKTFVQRPTTFRINSLKGRKEESDPTGHHPRGDIKTFLEEQGFKLKQVSWYHDAFILLNKSKRELMETKEYLEGKIYIQSLASMLPPLVLDPKPGERVLDLTAAPGSKTSQIAALMNRQGELVANDNNKPRFFKLKHNMEMLGVADTKPDWTFTLRMEHGAGLCKEYPNYFDKILLDAPCSAEARFIQGEPKTYGYWSERKIKEMAYKQRQMLLSVWQALKPGGTLVYSTCTFAPEENEEQISRLLTRYEDAEMSNIDLAEPKTLPPLTAWKEKQLHPEIKKAIRIKPAPEIEGFFIAKIIKKV